MDAAARLCARAAARGESGLAGGHGQDLPDSVDVALLPRTVVDEPEVEQPAERLVDVVALHAQDQRHVLAPVEGRAGAIGREREQAYVEDVLTRVSTTPASRIAELTPWGWAAARAAEARPSAS
jgi:hypothetical protein